MQARWPQYYISLGKRCLCAAERSLRKSTNTLTQHCICIKFLHPIIRFGLSSRARCCSVLSSCWCSFLLFLLFSCLSSIPFIHHPCIFVDLPALSFSSDRQSDTQTEKNPHKPQRQMFAKCMCLLLINPNGNMSIYVFICSCVHTLWMFVQAGGDVFDLLFPCEGRKLLCSCILFCKANDLGASRFQ